MKLQANGQQNRVAKPELLAVCIFRGGLAEWLNAADCKSVDGAYPTVQGVRIPYPPPDIDQPHLQR